jgi:hypothetical protein
MLLPYIAICILSIPLATRLMHDRKGAKHPNNYWIITGIIMIACSAIVTFWILPSKNLIQTFALSFGIYNTLFPYLITPVMKAGGVPGDYKWYDHLSATAWPDKVDGWAKLDWRVRMLMLSFVMAACVCTYVCFCKILSFYNPCQCL